MKFDDVVKERKSVRSFKPKRVAFGDLLEAIDCAMQGPFAGNMENLKFIIIEDEKNKFPSFPVQKKPSPNEFGQAYYTKFGRNFMKSGLSDLNLVEND